MDEILQNLPADALVLDLGCATGSFPRAATRARVVRVDQSRFPLPHPEEMLVQATAGSLPFRDAAFDALIANHSLEHFTDLGSALKEMGRVVRSEGAIYVSVPDASTLTDKVYRWLSRGGGHVNAFTDERRLMSLIENATGLAHAATRVLYSSLSMLNRRNSPRPRPRRLLLVGGGFEWSLFLYAWFSRRLDRHFSSRTSIYGWAFYFGNIRAVIDTAALENVCVRCGSGHPRARLLRDPNVANTFLGPVWRCPICSATNPYHH